MSSLDPHEIRDALERVRAAGSRLRERPARETLRALARVLDLWRNPASPWRAELEREIPRATGFHPALVREGMSRALTPWSGEALLALVEEELGGAEAFEGRRSPLVRGFETTAVVLAGALPPPSFLAILAPLALRSPVLVKTSSQDPVTADCIARSVAEVDPELAACIEVLHFSRDHEACTDALFESDCVVATGSDVGVAAMAARVPAGRRLVTYGHRVSLTALGPSALSGSALEQTANRIAVDTAMWDQLGCLSPLWVFVVGGDESAPDRLGEALARALEDAEKRWPRGSAPATSLAEIAREQGEAEMRGVGGARVRVWTGAGRVWTVVRDDGAALRASPRHRFLRIVAVSNLDRVAAALAPLRRHLAGVALAGFGPETDRARRVLASLGASRICVPGELQSPPLSWHHDGRGVLEPLALFTDLE